MKLKSEEEYLHIACFTWVKLNEKQYPCLKLAFHPANGGSRNIIEAVKLKKMGVRAGVPDFMLPCIREVGWKAGLAIEFKSKTGTMSQPQTGYMDLLAKAGWVCYVIRDLQKFIEAVSEYCKCVEYFN
jgi:hypothetical protein